jgi:cbb3-type cytochrome oxidase maturation protein
MSEINETSGKKSNGAYLAIILLLLIGLGAMAFLWSKKNRELNDCSNENTTLKSDMEGMNQMMSGYVDNMSNDLKADFKNMLKTYDALIAKDKSKADSLNMQKEKIQSLIDEIDRNKKMSASQLFQLRKENETLRGIMKGYVVQIDSLNTLNLKLTSDLDQTTTKLNSTTEERDQYKADAEQKAEQVKKGSRLQAYGFTSVGLKMKLNNTTEVTNRAKSVVQIKSTFTVSENPITESGKKVVYMQVINPDGKTMQTRSSNTIQTELGNIAYSDKKEIDYQNQRIDLSIFYDLKGEEALKGNYKVKIYCEGNLIGTDSFTLK